MASTMWRQSILRGISIASAASSFSPASFSRQWLSSSSRRFVALWGNGDFGRLGLGSLESRWRPTACPFFNEDDPIVSVSCGGAHTLFLTESGQVYATGLNNFGQLGRTSAKTHMLEPFQISGLPDKVVQISAGYHHSAAVTGADSIVSTPTRVDTMDGICIKMVALGSEHSIAVTDEGNVLSWGSGGAERLGHAHQSSILGFSFSSRMILLDPFMQ